MKLLPLVMAFSAMSQHFNNWVDNFSHVKKNKYQGHGTTNYPRNHKSKKRAKAHAKNRAGKKARRRNRK